MHAVSPLMIYRSARQSVGPALPMPAFQCRLLRAEHICRCTKGSAHSNVVPVSLDACCEPTHDLPVSQTIRWTSPANASCSGLSTSADAPKDLQAAMSSLSSKGASANLKAARPCAVPALPTTAFQCQLPLKVEYMCRSTGRSACRDLTSRGSLDAC